LVLVGRIGHLEDILLHRGVTTGSGGGSSSIGVVVRVAADKVIGHLRVELLGRLLGRATAAAAPGRLLGTLASGGVALASVRRVLLHSGSRLGLDLGLRDALSERLGLRDEVGRGNDNLNLDRLAVDEQTVEGGESLAGAVRLLERDVRDATANATGSV
jgi:hypothetical protein